MVSAFIQKLLNREQTPRLSGGVTYGADDLIADTSLTNAEKQKILQNNLISENQRLDNELRKDKAKQYLGAALQIGSAAIPIGAGARLGAGITKALAPRVGRKIAQEIGTGLAGGTVSGAVEGFGRGLIEDESPLKTMATDSFIGGLSGGVGGYGLGKLAQRFERGAIQNNPIAQRQYFDNYIADLSNKTNAMADFRGLRQGYNGNLQAETMYDLADDLSGLQDYNGFNLKLFKSPKISINMGKAMEQGYYPAEQIRTTLSRSTKAGKKLQQLFDDNKTYKQNYRVNYTDPNSGYYNELTGNMDSGKPMYFDTLEQAEQFANTVQDPRIKLVDEWHHINRGERNKLIDVNKLKDLGFKIDTSTANKEFKLKMLLGALGLNQALQQSKFQEEFDK